MRLFHAPVFLVIYVREIIFSTLRIARLALTPKLELSPCFVEVPLHLQGEFPRFLFACLISMTPGSLSVGLDAERGVLHVHLLDAPDPGEAIRELKEVFEQTLIGIFHDPKDAGGQQTS